MKTIDTLIIGAGISGLMYAVNTDEDYLIVEKEGRAGGLCKTFYQDGFIWDYAGHFFHFANSELKDMFEQEISSDNLVRCIKETNINYKNNIIEYPFQMNIHQLPKDEFIDCLYDLNNRNEKTNYCNFEEMLYGKFGRSITEKFLKPYNEKLYACNLNDLDESAMGRFFPYASMEQIINNMKKNTVESYNTFFDYPKKGAQLFVDVLLKKIPLTRIKYNSSVETINFNEQFAIISGEKWKYKKLINTMPFNHFVKILHGVDLNNINSILSCNKVLVFNLGFDKKAIDTKTHWTYVPMKNINFYRVGYYSNILGTDRLSMYVEISFNEYDDINISKQLETTLINLRELGIITDHELVSHNSLIINPGYVHITNSSKRAVNEMIKKLKEGNIFTIGRYGKWTYCSIEDCMIDAIMLANK